MRTAVSILVGAHILLIGLMGGSAHEVRRIGGLLQHYRWHQEQADGSMDVLRFLALHYQDPAHQATDREHHDGLPFRGHHAPAPLVVLAPEVSEGTPHPTVVDPPGVRCADGAEPAYLVGHLGRIFHPPKA